MLSTPRRSPRQSRKRSLIILSLLALVLALAACGATSAQFQNVGEDLKGGGTVPGVQPAGGRDLGGAPAPGPVTGEDGKSLASLADQKIIKTGEISVEVPDVTAALVRVRAMAVELGGYVGGSQAGTKDQTATLTLRIPADRFDDAIARLHKLDGDVIVEATNEQDVTSAVVDLEARITNLQASEVQYRALLAKAVKIEDILAVQTRLDDVRGQIEQLQAQHKELAGLADLSTLTVTLVPSALQQQAGSWDPGKTVADAFAALVGVAQGVGNGAIWFAIVWLPALIGLGIVVLILWRLTPGLRGRLRREPKAG
jgi:predicted small secreted protein